MTLAMSGATESDAGLASGLVNTTVQVGGAIGLALLATFATERTEGLAAGEPPARAQRRLPSGVPHRRRLVAVAFVVAVAVLRSQPARVELHEIMPDAARPAYSEAA